MRAVALILAIGCAPAAIGPAPLDMTTSDAGCAPRLDGTLATDTLNCGGCGPTPTGTDHRFGTPYNWHCCAGRAYDAQIDPLHCGTCETVCPEGTQCADWICQ